MNIDLVQLPQMAKKASETTKKLFKKVKKNPPRNLDNLMQDLHEKVFADTDCLQCANCCKTTSPVFTNKDIDKLAQYLRIKPGHFISKYLHIDEDGDYVLNIAPCPFLLADNTCQVYTCRPAACKEYPHTKRKNFHQILDLTIRNTYICPAAFRIIEKLNKVL